MLEINNFRNSWKMLTEMEKRSATNDFYEFVSLYEQLEQQDLINPQKLLDVSREVTLEQLDIGLAINDPLTILIDKYLRLPNICDSSVPVGPDNEGDVVIFESGRLNPNLPASRKTYEEIGEILGIFSNEISKKVTGEGFPFVFDKAATLNRALINYMLNTHIKNGYKEIVVPTTVNEKSMFNTGAFPAYGKKSFHIEGTDLFLNPTIEVQQTNLLRNVHFISPTALPLRLVGYSRSFRIEDKPMTTYTTLHEFGKVEIFVATKHEKWKEEYNRALGSVEEMLGKLELPFRKVLLCSGSLGQGQALVHDYYVYAPGSDKWWEVASCAYNGDFSSRRMNATYFDKNNKVKYVDTLHITAVSIPRMVSAVLENFQQEDGSVSIPDALVGYMQGISQISPDNQMKLNFT